ncbi:MAG: tyrosine-protein phosphatase [Amphritea sp.]|nr:tyrosine-protein phosphatase [Amphritea sp.]
MSDKEDRCSRGLNLEGGINFRDLGGYETQDGRTVRWRTLLRSGHLADLTDSDINVLEALSLNHIHDLRKVDEQQRTPNRSLQATTFADYQMQIGSLARFWDYLDSGGLSAESAHQLVSQGYRKCVPRVTPKLSQILHSLLDNAGQASLFHCTAGKDRTGIVVATVLAALGVERQTIIEDYLLTLEYFDNRPLLAIVEQHLRDAGVTEWERSWLTPYISVHEENIVQFLAGIDEQFGSFDRFVNEGLGLSDQQVGELRDGYLE